MDAQAYSVAVRVGAEDNLSRVLMAISQDAIKLHERFQQINKDLQGITASANKAAAAFKNMTMAANGQFSGATNDARAYADSMDRAARSATSAASASRDAGRAAYGMSPVSYLAVGYAGGSMGQQGRLPSPYALASNGSGYSPQQLLLGYGGGGRGGAVGPFGANGDYIHGGGGRGPSGRTGNTYDADFDRLPPPPGGGNGAAWNPPPPNPPKGGKNNRFSHSDAMGNLVIGYAGFEFLDDAAKRGLEYERAVARLRQMGLSKQQVSYAENFVNSSDIKNTSVLDRMRIFTDAQGSFRESGMTGPEALSAAKAMTPILANYEVAMGVLGDNTKSATIANLKNLNKTIEIMGGTHNIKRAMAVSDAVFEASQSSGGLVDENQLKHFVSYGSSAVNAQSLRAIFGGLEPIIGEFGGMQTATGLTTAYIRTNGMLSLPPKILDREMARLGIADKTGKEQTHDLSVLQATNAIDYAQKLLNIYHKHRINTQIDRERENSILLGRTGAKIYNRIMAQMEVLKASEKGWDRSNGASQIINDPDNHQLMARQNLETKWENLQLALAKDGGVLDKFTQGVDYLGIAINKITQEMQAHPELTKLAADGAMAVIAMAGVSGGLWLLNHAAKGVFKPLTMLGRVILSLVRADSVPLLVTKLGLLPATITGILAAITAYSAYKVYDWYQNGKTDSTFKGMTSAGSKGASDYNISNPNADADYRHLLNPSRYPAAPVPSKNSSSDNRPVNLYMTSQGKQVLIATVTDGMSREANRPPMGSSSFDASVGLLYSGLNSQLFPR